MKGHRQSPVSKTPGFETSMPPKKKEKNRISSHTVAEGYTGFMHSLMGEEAIKDNKQHMAQKLFEATPIQRVVPSTYTSDNSPANYQLNMGSYTDANNHFIYPTQSHTNTILKLDSSGGINDVDVLDGNNSGGYDYMKTFQMIPMQRFIGSNGQDSYKYDNSANHHQTGDVANQQIRAPIYPPIRDLPQSSRAPSESNSNAMSYFTKYEYQNQHCNPNLNLNLLQNQNLNPDHKKAFSQNQAARRSNNFAVGMGEIDKCDVESETHSMTGCDLEQEHDPAKRKTRNQREQKRYRVAY